MAVSDELRGHACGAGDDSRRSSSEIGCHGNSLYAAPGSFEPAPEGLSSYEGASSVVSGWSVGGLPVPPLHARGRDCAVATLQRSAGRKPDAGADWRPCKVAVFRTVGSCQAPKA